MYVCVCHGITDREIRAAADAGCRDVHELTMRLGCGASCGSCLPLAEQILAEAGTRRPLPLPVLEPRAA